MGAPILRCLRCLAALPLALAAGLAAAQKVEVTPQVRPIEPRVQLPVRRVVPNVVGQELGVAQATLGRTGFESRAVAEDRSSDGRRIVSRTDPAAGAGYTAANLPVVTVWHRRDPASAPAPSPAPPPATRVTPRLPTERLPQATQSAAQTTPAGTPATPPATQATPPTRTLPQAVPLPGTRQLPQATPQPDVRTPTDPRTAPSDTRTPSDGRTAPDTRAPPPFWPSPVQPQPQPQPPPVDRSPWIPMPDLVGLSCEQAQREIARLLGQPLACERGTPGQRFAPGTVQRQEPPARTPVVPGRALPARVWIEPAVPTVIVPSLLGQTADAAAQRLREVRLVPRFDPPRPGPWHRVRVQQPAAGSRVPPETVVTAQLAPRLTVPDLVGRDCAQAQELARTAGFPGVQCEDEDAPADAAAGRVRRQQPPAGSVLDAPRPLQAWTARPRTRVPDLRGQPEAQALQAARNARLVPQAQGPAAAAGRIVAGQAPAAGALVAPDSALELRLALTVPNLAGRRCEAAQPVVRTHGFAELRCEERPARAGEALRLIVEQQPAAGTALTAPQPLRAVVAMPTVVPAVEGQPLAEAEALVARAGLRARADAGDGEREVQQQQPAAGSEVAPGAVVQLRTRRLVAVPDLVGRTPAEAEAAAAQAGLGARPDVADGARRRVRGQDPEPGRRVPAGTEVRLATVKRVAVPDLREASCAEAGQATEATGLALTRCDVESRVPLVLGTPRIARQAPAPGTEVDERSAVVATALPPWWSLPTLIGGVLGAALGLAWKFVPAKPPKLPMGWRVVPDATPRVTVRPAAPDDAGAAGGDGPAWRVERPPPRVWLRGLEDDEP